jgi:hypothetical protein
MCRKLLILPGVIQNACKMVEKSTNITFSARACTKRAHKYNHKRQQKAKLLALLLQMRLYGKVLRSVDLTISGSKW